jgi:hypothetical protein
MLPTSQMEPFARMLFIHQIHEGAPIDVTKEHPEVQTLIDWGEQNGYIEIDVKQYRYALTPKGRALYEQQLAEAQNIIRRYDIYGDVDVDASGKARFDTGLGADLRVAVWELEGIDPFRARFLLGLNDEEWSKDPDWTKLAFDERWYDEVFSPIEQAPAVQDVGADKLRAIIDEGKVFLRSDPAFDAANPPTYN